jgi:hypothetical protein
MLSSADALRFARQGALMRTRSFLAVLLLSGCAHWPWSPPPPPPPTLTLSEDGTTLNAGGEQWTAPEGATFYQRGMVVHVVSTQPGRTWDVAVPLGPDGKLLWPKEAPFAPAEGALVPTAGKAAPEVEQLVESGQLHPHDDHYHLTHRFQNDDWQAMYRLRTEESPLPPLRRQVAATILALLLDERIPGTSAEATDQALRRMVSIIGKARRAIEGDVGARAIETIITYDFEIRDDGATLDVGGQRFHAVAPVRFSYCSGHFHVEDSGGKWAQPVELEGHANGAFAWPSSIFFEVRQGGDVAERPASTRWRRLADTGQVRFTRDHWHVTEAYAHPRLQHILKAIGDERLPDALRDKARALALDVMSLRLDLGSDAEFGARLDAIDQAIDRADDALEKAGRGTPASRR